MQRLRSYFNLKVPVFGCEIHWWYIFDSFVLYSICRGTFILLCTYYCWWCDNQSNVFPVMYQLLTFLCWKFITISLNCIDWLKFWWIFFGGSAIKDVRWHIFLLFTSKCSKLIFWSMQRTMDICCIVFYMYILYFFEF